MDIPTYIVISSLAVFIAIIILLKLSRAPELRWLGVLSFSASAIWICLTLCGEFLYHWTKNSMCSKYLGCGEGFFGYDAFQHLFAGIAIALAIVYLCRRFPKYSILRSRLWENILIIIALVALIAVVWEFAECAHDFFRVSALHEQLVSYRLHFQFNYLDQPTNLDTMGDLAFSLCGSIAALFFAKLKE
ncbi:MAG TPA: hypothetical protein VMR49_01545 [Candidatus Paceibacterota bacterium]|nr:hypothetical protein [Candidatus Paceibacterota bacterium]